VSERSGRRFRATVHYDGGEFHGWQIQPTVRTVQGRMEAALAELFQNDVRVLASGRTDRGVHAVGQETAFTGPGSWSPGDLRQSLNALLPPGIWVERLTPADDSFHPRYDATARRYAYLVGTREDAASPLRRRGIWQLCREPDTELLRRETGHLSGERSFRAFAKSGQPERGTRCRVARARWSRTGPGDLHFLVEADRFLHHMVRYLVSTLIEVAVGRREPGDVRRLLEGGEARPPEPAPPQGLYLASVRYPDGWNRDGSIPGLAPAAVEPA